MSAIYFDMDGVIADFFGGLEKKYDAPHWKSIKWKDSIYVDLRGTDFFNTLNMFTDTVYMVDAVIMRALENDLEWGICSSPLRGDEYNSAYWKRRWLESYLLVPKDLDNLIFTANKEKYAIHELDWRPNILIDDKPENIRKWETAGGIGIRFQANIDDVKDYLLPELDKAINKVNSIPRSSDRS